jgi:hypothetical protein
VTFGSPSKVSSLDEADFRMRLYALFLYSGFAHINWMELFRAQVDRYPIVRSNSLLALCARL